jgi:hypothetical protein
MLFLKSKCFDSSTVRVGQSRHWYRFRSFHTVPCEAWINNKRVFYNDNCTKLISQVVRVKQTGNYTKTVSLLLANVIQITLHQ